MPLKILNEKFFDRVKDGIADTEAREVTRTAQEITKSARIASAAETGNWEAWRQEAANIRAHTISHLDTYLSQLADNVEKHGGHVFFANTPEEARAYIQEVAKKTNSKKIIKSKSMVTEEFGLNHALEEIGCKVLETDLGEYILQLSNSPPSHIVMPALHFSKEQIQVIFQKYGYTGTSDMHELVNFAREQLRPEFLSADMGITGCNFAVAESGSVCIVTNEGDGRMVTGLPKTLVTVMGMERIVPTFTDLELLVTMLTRSAVGKVLTSYISIFTGVKQPGEVDGPEEFHLVIVDNNRSKILGTEFQDSLRCIRCAACINVCPIYRNIGGHAYGTIYPGPIGAVITPLLADKDDFKELPYASTLCAACTEACPVKIPLHELLIKHRNNYAEKAKKSPLFERIAMKLYGWMATHPALFRWVVRMAPFALKPFVKDGKISKGPGPLKLWNQIRDLPQPSKENLISWFKKHGKK